MNAARHFSGGPIKEHWLHALKALEQQVVQYDVPAPENDDALAGVAMLPGVRPVLVSAPHATRHRRANSWKREDEYTAAIAHWLHEQSGVHAIYPTHRIDPDPHDDHDRGDYKQAIQDIIRAHDIRLVLDLHGARGDRDFALALGSIHSQTCKPYEVGIIRAFEAEGFSTDGVAPSLDRLAVNLPKYAGGTHMRTVTRFVWERLGIPTMQIEINSWARIVERLPASYEARHGIAPDFRGDPVRISRMLSGLLQIIMMV